MAAELGLVTADKPDSQDICFVPSGNYAGVVEKLKPGAATPGEIVDLDGHVLGRHEGVIHYTVGQRKGLGLSGNGEPLFVVRLDAGTRPRRRRPARGAGHAHDPAARCELAYRIRWARSIAW